MPYVFNPFTGSFDDTVPLQNGKVPADFLPSYVDDILEFANVAAFPATGETGKIYLALDTNITYRWGGSQYTATSIASLSSIGDVNTTSTAPTDGQALTWDQTGSVWKPGDVLKSEPIDVYAGSRTIQNCIYLPEATWNAITTPNEDVLYVVTPFGQGGTPSLYYYPSPDPNYIGDPDALTYLTAVEVADGQVLEPAVKSHIQTFILDCKADGIWEAIKSSCIYAGARTVAGALVTLKGASTTNVGFTQDDYNRVTGLKGNGSSKYVNTNRNHATEPINDHHLSVYVTDLGTSATSKAFIGVGNFQDNGSSLIEHAANGNPVQTNFHSQQNTPNGTNATTRTPTTGFLGLSRNNSSNFNIINGNLLTTTLTRPSETPMSASIFTHRSNSWNTQYSDARIAFYSIGTNINLTLLKNRVEQLMTNLASTLA